MSLSRTQFIEKNKISVFGFIRKNTKKNQIPPEISEICFKFYCFADPSKIQDYFDTSAVEIPDNINGYFLNERKFSLYESLNHTPKFIIIPMKFSFGSTVNLCQIWNFRVEHYRSGQITFGFKTENKSPVLTFLPLHDLNCNFCLSVEVNLKTKMLFWTAMQNNLTKDYQMNEGIKVTSGSRGTLVIGVSRNNARIDITLMSNYFC